jgi:peptidoglycan L-alanyl-D-glutamate endopeptidase CwlK
MTTRDHPAAPRRQQQLHLAMPGMGRHKSQIKALQRALLKHGFNPGKIDGIFGSGTQAAVLAYQRSEGLLADGIAGVRTLAALQGCAAPPLASVLARFGTDVVAQMFPHTPRANIRRNLPFVLGALDQAQLCDRPMVLAALATIRAETESFEPVAESRSRYNTSPGPAGHPFDLYDRRKDLGNEGPPDGARFRGRGYVQLTGRANYAVYGKSIGLGGRLVEDPELASEPDIAARLLAAFLKDRELRLKQALLERDYAGARRLVNGGRHGLTRFAEAYRIGIHLTA